MATVLLTAFEPYDCWAENSSWLALIELTKDLPDEPVITTRRYPCDFAALREKLEDDLARDYDFAIHLGQSPGSGRVLLEAIGLNVGGASDEPAEAHRPLIEDGPVAFRTDLPVNDWAVQLRKAGIPCQVSYHAGTFLCNATLYLSHYIAQQRQLKTRTTFVHLPLEVSQALATTEDYAAMPKATMVAAVRWVLNQLGATE